MKNAKPALPKWLSRFSDRKFVLAFLAAAFLFSVLVRLPYLGRPLSERHEWLTSTSLVHIRAFYEQGFEKLHFSPSLTYGNPADKNIGFHWNLRDSEGNIYYCSFPPFAFIFPAFIFKLLQIYPEVLGLQLFNIFFHLVSCVFVYLVLLRLTAGRSKDRAPAILGFLIYLFAPSPMWFQSNVYMSDMFVQPFFIMGIWLFLRMTGDEKRKWLFEILFALNLFAFVYTEWMGVFFAAAAFILLLIRAKGTGAFRTLRLLAIVAAATTASLALTFWQYSQISGVKDLLDYLRGKFLFRTGTPGYASGGQSFLNVVAWLNILVNYIGGFLPFLVLIVLLSVRKRKTPLLKGDPARTAAAVLSLAPVILHHLVFFNFTTVHDFSALKGGVFIAIITALLYDNSPGVGERKKPAVREIYALAAAVVFSILMYYLVDGYGAHDRYKKIGETVMANSRTNEVIFVNGLGSSPNPQYLVYARRGLEPWDGLEKAKLLMRKNGIENGVLFEWKADKAELVSTVRFTVNDRTIKLK